MCAVQKPLGDTGKTEMYALLLLLLLLFRIHLLLLLFRILSCVQLRKKQKGKRLRYLRCRNSLMNHGDISMLSRA